MKFFEILGITKTWFGSASKIYPEQIQIDRHGKSLKLQNLMMERCCFTMKLL